MSDYIQKYKIGKSITLQKTNYYQEKEERIVGFTITKEEYKSQRIHEYQNGILYREYNFNLWLWWIGLHVIIRNEDKRK